MAGKFGTGLAAAGGALVGSLAGAFVGGELRGRNGKMWAGAAGTLLGAFSGAALMAATPNTVTTTTTGAGAPKLGAAPKGFGAGFFQYNAIGASPSARPPAQRPQGRWQTVSAGQVPADVQALLARATQYPGEHGTGVQSVVARGARWLRMTRAGRLIGYYRWVPSSAAVA